MNIKESKKILPEKILKEMKESFKEFKLTEDQKRKALTRIIELYKKTCYEPGEAIGVVSAQSISEPGTQLSLSADEKVIVAENNLVKIVKIGEFIDKLIEQYGKKIIDNSEVCKIPKNAEISVPSLKENGKISWKQVLECSRHKYRKKLLKIKTRSGRSIIATPNHSFVVRKNLKIIPIRGNELKYGDMIPVILNLSSSIEKKELNLRNYFNPNQYWYGSELNKVKRLENWRKLFGTEFNVPVSMDRLAHVIGCQPLTTELKEGFVYPYQVHGRGLPENLNLDSNLGWLIGAYLSEGCSTKYWTGISNTSNKYLSMVKEFTKIFDLTYNEYRNEKGFSPKNKDIRINSMLLAKLLKITCGSGAINKHVPDFAFTAPDDFVCALLRGYFDGDGSITISRKGMRAMSTSKNLLDGIALLLTRIGIPSTKSFSCDLYWLHIPFRYLSEFEEKIGSDLNKKDLKKLSEIAKTASKKTYDSIVMISGFGDVLRKIAKQLNFPTRYINNFTKRQRIGIGTLQRYIKLFEKIAQKRNIDISKDLKKLSNLCEEDVFWDMIVSIEYVEPTNYVYDFSVAGLETFSTFDGIITHNTMRSYHIAGAAQIQVTLGLPRLIEIFDARRSPKTPMMTVYLQKNYNTKEKAKKLALEIQETKLSDIAINTAIDLLNMQIEILIDLKASRERELKLSKIINILKETTKNIKIKLKREKIIIAPKTEMNVKELQKMKSKILSSHIKGVKRINQIIINQKDSEWVISTLGSNLAKVLEISGVDQKRTTSNNIHEVLKVLGVEAARTAIINEASSTLKEQGLDVDVRHIMLVADVMTADGKIKAIGRYGVAGAKGSVLARANFEETIKHLTKAAVTAEEDKLESVVENVMINQVVPVGTGMFDLVFKAKKQ